jgi:endo-1,4-beta-xylanase
MPSIIENSDLSGIDYWVICDDADCYMFFSANNSVLYRARTTKEAFPEGFEGTTEIVMQDELYRLYDACNVYRLEGTDQYLLLVSAIGEGRYFQSWTSDRLDSTWTPLADTESDSFASVYNVTGADWSNWGVSHGEMLRTNPDETMTIDPCNMQYLFSGLKTSEENPENEYYCLGLLTSTK